VFLLPAGHLIARYKCTPFADTREKFKQPETMTLEDRIARFFGEGTTANIIMESGTGGFGAIGAVSTAAGTAADFVPANPATTDAITYVRAWIDCYCARIACITYRCCQI